MKKLFLLLLVALVLLVSFVSAASLLSSQENVTRITQGQCPFGEYRCSGRAFQVCDGSFWVTKHLCALQETCDVEKRCIPRAERVSSVKGQSKSFYQFRYRECREGHLICNNRFLRKCVNNKWTDIVCPLGTSCHPKEGCVSIKTTRFRARELGIPSTQLKA